MIRALALLAGLAAGGSLSQVPEFAQQYAQRVGGAHDEAVRQLADFQDIARQLDLTLPALIDRYAANEDPAVVALADLVGRWLARERYLRDHLAELEGGPMRRLAAMATERDPAIAARAWEAFRPALPATAEGLTHGLAGFAIGYLFIAAIGRAARPRRRA